MSTNLWPFFCFYGGKWRIARKYPEPMYDTIVEPFAGSAGYSVRYPHKKVKLYDVDEHIVGVWDYLIKASEADILALPIEVDHIDDIACTQEEKWLIGFWLNKACTSPRKSPSRWMRDKIRPNSFWGEAIRTRLAEQSKYIKHWEVKQGCYTEIQDTESSWFIDPPYNNKAGKIYRYSDVDYKNLSEWCQSRSGQVIVCENEGADWLPFTYFTSAKSMGGRGKAVSKEVVWYGNKT